MTSTFTVTNGDDGRSIVSITPPATPGQPGATDTYTINYSEAPTTSTFVVYNGEDGIGTPTATVASPVGNTGSAGTAGAEFANPDHVHAHGNQTNPAHHAVATGTDNGFMSSLDFTKLDGIAAGAEVNQNAFSVVTGNTGTATADAKTDTLAITGGTGISTAATDTPDGLVITNTGVTQFNGRTGNVSPQQADYDAFFTTPAEAASAAPVQSVFGRSGAVTALSADYSAFYQALYFIDARSIGISSANTADQNTTAFNNWFATAPVNFTLQFPDGTFDFNGELTLNRNLQGMFRGMGKARTILRITNATANLFHLSISAYYYSFEELGFNATVTKTAGAFIKTNPAAGDNAYLDVRRCEMKNYFNGISLDGVGAGNVGTISEVLMNTPVANSVGLRINGENINMMITNCTINQNPGSAGLGTCVEVLTSGAVQFMGCDFIGGQFTLDVNPTAAPVSALYFTNCFFDQSGNTTVLFRGTRATSRVKFLQCGITNGNVTNAIGLSIAGTGTGINIPEALDFELCDFYNSFNGLASTGISLTGVRGIDIRNCRISGFTVGIDITPYSANGVTNFGIQGNTIGPTENFPGNGTGIRVNAGAVQYGSYILIDNDLSGNTVAPLVELGTVDVNSTELIRNNIGLVSVPSNVFVGANLPLTTVTRIGSAISAPASGQRIGTRGQITATVHKSAATASTLTLTLRNGVNNTNADAAIATLALGAGTAATGGATIIAEWQVVSATTAMASIHVRNNGATGVTNAAVTNVTTLGPIAITNINTLSFWGLYGSVATAANIVIDTVGYEVPNQ